MTASTQTGASPKVTYREVFASREYRAVCVAQLVSMAGDQFARIALAVLVFDRTRSPLLAAVSFAVTPVAMTVGGLGLSWLGDRFPRRQMMVTADLVCLILVAVMAIPGVPLGVLIALLFGAGLAAEPFLDARTAVNETILGDRFDLGASATQTINQVAQLAGFAGGGLIAGLVGVRPALLIDAGTFAVSAVLIRFGVRAQPAADTTARAKRPEFLTGFRVVFGSPAARTAVAVMWLAAFFGVPEGVVVPLAHQLGGGPATAGWLLAVISACSAVGLALYVRVAGKKRARRFAAVMAVAACALLLLFVLPVTLAGAIAVLAVSGLCISYFPATAGVIMDAVPGQRRTQAMGLLGAGMYLGQAVMFVVAGAVATQARPSWVIAGCGAAGVAAGVPLAFAWRKAAAVPTAR